MRFGKRAAEWLAARGNPQSISYAGIKQALKEDVHACKGACPQRTRPRHAHLHPATPTHTHPHTHTYTHTHTPTHAPQTPAASAPRRCWRGSCAPSPPTLLRKRASWRCVAVVAVAVWPLSAPPLVALVLRMSGPSPGPKMPRTGICGFGGETKHAPKLTGACVRPAPWQTTCLRVSHACGAS